MKYAAFIALLLVNYSVAQGESIVQPLESHPYYEINEWYAHEGDLSLEKVTAHNPDLWEVEELNRPFWEKNGVKWFKQSITIPKHLDGLDVVLHINVSPQAIVYVMVRNCLLPGVIQAKVFWPYQPRQGENIIFKSKAGTADITAVFIMPVWWVCQKVMVGF